jgi:hypothetical protein
MKSIEKEIINLNKKKISKKELTIIIKRHKPLYKESSIGWVIYRLIRKNIITKLDAKTYYIGKLKIYKGSLSSELAKKVKAIINQTYPDVKFVIYESTMLNEWVNHQISRNVIFVEVEKYFMIDIFKLIQEKYFNVLLNPTRDYFYLYDGEIIVINQLVTQAPIDRLARTITLEKLIVDFYTKDLINEFINDFEKEEVIDIMFKSYAINTNTILAYSKRRNNYDTILKVLEALNK